jgi:hypothetical protein
MDCGRNYPTFFDYSVARRKENQWSATVCKSVLGILEMSQLKVER